MIVEVKMSTERPGAKNEEIWQKVNQKENFVIVNMTDKIIDLNKKSTYNIRLTGIPKRQRKPGKTVSKK